MSFKNAEEYLGFFQTSDGLGSTLGGRPISVSEAECIYEYDVSPKHFNPNGILHGGVLYSLMDSSQGLFVHFSLDRNLYRFAATGTATIKYLAPVRAGRIRIKTWLKGRERRKLFVLSSAVDDSGKEVATLEETWIAVLND